MRKNALKYVFDFMTFSTGNFNLITQINRFEHCFIPSKVIQYISSATVIRRRERTVISLIFAYDCNFIH